MKNMRECSNRIHGYDLARTIAIVGMVFVNFKVSMVRTNELGFLVDLIDSISGKAAALFVVLAGVGMTLMYQSAQKTYNGYGIKKVRGTLFKRSVFLFIAGFSYCIIWPADILHYYAIYLVIGSLMLSLSRNWLLFLSGLFILIFMLLCFVLDYDNGWEWSSMIYIDFFTLTGFFRNLLFNGYHPLFPWFAFLLIGIWLGRLNLTDNVIRRRAIRISIIVFGVVKILSYSTLLFMSYGNGEDIEAINAIFGTVPMPPFLFYMLSGASLSVFIICISITVSEKYKNNLLIEKLIKTGRMALSIYIGHVIIGMLSIYFITGKLENAYSIEFITSYSTVFCLISIIFSNLWLKKFKLGPIEYLMRKLTD